MTDSTRLPAVELSPRSNHRASIIWLHGLGADGNDFVSIVPELGLEELGVRFVFPHAPRRAVTINGGLVMPAWYDIVSIDLERHVPEEHLEESRAQLEAWIQHERSLGIPSEKIIVAGFSQGGAVALYTGIDFSEPLGGLVALSTYHPVPHKIEENASADRSLPIFMGHGSEDPIVPISLAELTQEKLTQMGYPVDWHTYRMPHSVNMDEIQDLADWLKKRLA